MKKIGFIIAFLLINLGFVRAQDHILIHNWTPSFIKEKKLQSILLIESLYKDNEIDDRNVTDHLFEFNDDGTIIYDKRTNALTDFGFKNKYFYKDNSKNPYQYANYLLQGHGDEWEYTQDLFFNDKDQLIRGERSYDRKVDYYLHYTYNSEGKFYNSLIQDYERKQVSGKNIDFLPNNEQRISIYDERQITSQVIQTLNNYGDIIKEVVVDPATGNVISTSKRKLVYENNKLVEETITDDAGRVIKKRKLVYDNNLIFEIITMEVNEVGDLVIVNSKYYLYYYY